VHPRGQPGRRKFPSRFVLTQFFLDRHKISLKTRARAGFAFFMTTRGAWWIWSTVMQTKYKTSAALDWADADFGRYFALYVLLGASFQTHYLFLYFLVQNGEFQDLDTLTAVVKSKADAPRAAGLLRAVESASQAVAYGTSSIASFALLGSNSLNFGLWGLAIAPSWLVIRRIGVDLWGPYGGEGEEGEKGEA
jgi:hypothetical protein